MTSRLAWPDVARGFSIVCVVLFHVCLYVPGAWETVWNEFNLLLIPVRMPLFFLIAGIFAAKLLRVDFLGLVCGRLWFLIVPYVVWAPLEILNSYLASMYAGRADSINWAVVFGNPLRGLSFYWFLYALVFFSLIVWLLKFVPERLRLVVPVALMVATVWMDPGLHITVERILSYLPVFLLGALLREQVFAFARSATRGPYVVAAVGLAAVAYYGAMPPYPAQLELLIDIVLSLLYMPLGICMAALIAATPVVGPFFQATGRHTLVIYISHALAISFGFMWWFHFLGLKLNKFNAYFWEQPSFWVVFLLVICCGFGFVFYRLMQVPALRWLTFPPTIEQRLRERWTS